LFSAVQATTIGRLGVFGGIVDGDLDGPTIAFSFQHHVDEV
jgi:hypothetical protein